MASIGGNRAVYLIEKKFRVSHDNLSFTCTQTDPSTNSCGTVSPATSLPPPSASAARWAHPSVGSRLGARRDAY